ncbi:MAG: leucyl aminopeptidase, partial [Rhodocyclaceae bacterium]|nr:leucyl aminopeptidase [Rhodocyclaceae bacterium]
MEFTIKTGGPEKQKTACLAIGVRAGKQLGGAFDALDAASDGALGKILSRGDLDDKAGATLMLHGPAGLPCERLLLVSLGESDPVPEKAWRDALAAVARVAASAGFKDLTVDLADAAVADRDLTWRLRQLGRQFEAATYRFDAPRAKKDDKADKGVAQLRVLLARRPADTDKAALAQGVATAEGMALTRDLGNLPGNVCTPTYLADAARKLGKDMKLKVEVLDQAQMEKLGMGSLLSVAKGSIEPPKLIVMHYKGGKAKDKPVVLVGKGITFDTGGISLKPGAEMDEMKYD